MKLLVVEEEPRRLELLAMWPGRKGLQCGVCREQKRAVGTARGYEFDTIVLDVMLPKMSGFELAKKLRGE